MSAVLKPQRIDFEQMRRDVAVSATHFGLNPDECYELAMHSPSSAATCYRAIAASLAQPALFAEAEA